MALIITNLTKKYNEQTVFKDLNLSFPDVGFVSILGKSGCGKSTLLHCLATLEKADSGDIYLNYEDITRYKEVRRQQYLNKDISLVFQHYQLIEDQSIIFNASLPMLIAGERKQYAYKRASELLKEVGFDEEKQSQLVNNCSGGEKQRVALIRSIINNPKIILADEPTGALDTKNSRVVMELLKKFSKQHLVIVVTHNKELAMEFSDRVITMGFQSVETENINEIKPKERYDIIDKNKKRNSNWINFFIEKNLRKRLKRNIISIVSLSISIIFTFIIIGFNSGADKEISYQSVRQFDLGVSTISLQKKTDIENSKLKLVQETRLSPLEINNFLAENPIFEYGLNYDYLVPPNIEIEFDTNKLSTFTFNPVYSFLDQSCPDFLLEGHLPKDGLEEVLINDVAYKEMFELCGKNPINSFIKVSNQREITTYFDSDKTPYIVDYFDFNKEMKIVGVVKELGLLNSPKIYYSFKALDEYMSDYLMSNLSKQYETDYSFKSKIDQCPANDSLSSYSYRLFLKDYSDFEKITEIELGDYQITNNSLKVREAISSFIEAATLGLGIFLIIAILGSVFILGIVSFSSYTQDQHSNAILLALGAKRDDVLMIYVFESLILGTISFFVSLSLSMVLSPLINSLLRHLTGFSNLIQIPIRQFINKRFFLPILMFGITTLVSVLSSYVPMAFSKRISIAKELKEE